MVFDEHHLHILCSCKAGHVPSLQEPGLDRLKSSPMRKLFIQAANKLFQASTRKLERLSVLSAPTTQWNCATDSNRQPSQVGRVAPAWILAKHAKTMVGSRVH
jgi:hypothetical protein